MSGAELIAAERQRQVEEEGRTAEHDQQHDRDELPGAAQTYLGAVALRRQGETNAYIRAILTELPQGWPWSWETFKPRDDVRDLVRAGALIAAELDRIQRAGSGAR